jgi:hypothetical protein
MSEIKHPVSHPCGGYEMVDAVMELQEIVKELWLNDGRLLTKITSLADGVALAEAKARILEDK